MVQQSNDDDITSPITLHVEKFSIETPTMEHLKRRRVTVVDLEINALDAEKLRKYLTLRIDEKIPGTIRVRFYGRLQI